MISGGGDGAETFWINDITLPSGTDATNSENGVIDFDLDSKGNLLVCGQRDDTTSGWTPLNGFILKIDKTNGTVVNQTDYSDGSLSMTPYGIAVDSNDDVYTYMSNGKLAKFDVPEASGAITETYSRESEWNGGATFGEGMSGNGCVYANGTNINVYGTSSNGYQLGLTFDATTGDISSGGYTSVNGGNQAYVSLYNSKNIGGTIYGCGKSRGGNTNGNNDYWVVANIGYGVSGSMKFYTGNAGQGACYGITRDSDNKLYVCGQMDNVPTLMKIDAFTNSNVNAGVAWGRKLDTSGRYADIAADSQGCVYAATLGGQIVKYNSSGTIIWAKVVANNISRIEIIDDVIHGIGTIGNTSIKVFRLPISGDGLNDWSITHNTFNYVNQGGLGGPATQSDFGSTQNGSVIWNGWTSSDFSMSLSSQSFSSSVQTI